MGVPNWEVEATDDYIAWFEGLDEREQDVIVQDVDVLRHVGPQLGRPYVDTIASSRHSNMKELRSRATLRTFSRSIRGGASSS